MVSVREGECEGEDGDGDEDGNEDGDGDDDDGFAFSLGIPLPPNLLSCFSWPYRHCHLELTIVALFGHGQLSFLVFLSLLLQSQLDIVI